MVEMVIAVNDSSGDHRLQLLLLKLQLNQFFCCTSQNLSQSLVFLSTCIPICLHPKPLTDISLLQSSYALRVFVAHRKKGIFRIGKNMLSNLRHVEGADGAAVIQP